VTFFVLASMPLLLLLFAWRGWPGLGYSWHLSWHELRDALLAGTVGAMAMGLVGLLGNAVPIGTPGAGQLLTAVMSIYFLGALPVELLLRGGVQNGLERALRERLGGAGRWAALALTVALAVLVAFATRPDYFYGVIGAIVVGLAAGWVYQRTGKVTVSAVTHALIILVWASLMGGVAS
jgi:membrane protease YdiL (CAAX protease family)